MLITNPDYKFIVVAQIIYNNTKSQDFERGVQTLECKLIGSKYDIKEQALMPYVSYIKFYNNINRNSFKIRKSYKQIIELINNMDNDKLLDLIELIEEAEKDFCLLSFLSNKKEDKK